MAQVHLGFPAPDARAQLPMDAAPGDDESAWEIAALAQGLRQVGVDRAPDVDAGIRVDLDAADAGIELLLDRGVLVRTSEAVRRRRHGVVRGRERDLVEWTVAELDAAAVISVARNARRALRT